MKTTTPKEHPTFKRAIGLAHKALLSQRDKLSARVEHLVDSTGLDESEASGLALAELAQGAFEDAVDTLSRECSRHARVEYVVEGSDFLDEACRRMLCKPDALGIALANALSSARDGMPGHVKARLEFGCREDGLIFGRARHEAIGGSFAALQSCVASAMDEAALAEARESALADGASPEAVEALAPKIAESMRPALRSIARQALPSDDASAEGRPLSAHVEDLCERLSKLKKVEFSADSESWHTLTGQQASDRLRQISAEADAERPNAAGLSAFLSKLGI